MIGHLLNRTNRLRETLGATQPAACSTGHVSALLLQSCKTLACDMHLQGDALFTNAHVKLEELLRAINNPLA